MKTPWSKNAKPEYQKQELRTARKPGARAQVNSGRTWSSLRDVAQQTVIGRVLIDNKTTDKRSYSVSLDGKDGWFSLKRDANRTPPGCLPALQVDIQGVSLLIIEEGTFDEIMEYVEELEGRLGNAG